MKIFSPFLARLALTGALLFGGGAAHAGIPVIDVAGLVQAIQEVLNSMQQINNQVRQITQLQDQLRQLEQQYDAITGIRNLGDILNSPALQEYIPADAANVVNDLRSTGYSALSGTAKAMRDAQMTYNCLDMAASARSRCQSSLAMPFQEKAFMQDAMSTASGRITQIQSLMRRINTTTDTKAVGEIQARIEAENAMLQHQQTQINLARGMAEAEARIEQAQAREGQLQQASRTGRLADFVAP